MRSSNVSPRSARTSSAWPDLPISARLLRGRHRNSRARTCVRPGSVGCSGCGNAGAAGGLALTTRLHCGWVAGRLLNTGTLDWSHRPRAALALGGTAEVRFSQVERADDVRRQRQDDVGLDRLLAVAGEQPADKRDVAQAWNAVEDRPLFIADEPASMFVWPSFSRMVDVICRDGKRRQASRGAGPVPEILLNSILNVSDTSSS